MKKNTITINVSLDVAKSQNSNVKKQASLKQASCLPIFHTEKSINKSGLHHTKTLKQITNTSLNTVTCSTLSKIESPLASSNELQKINNIK